MSLIKNINSVIIGTGSYLPDFVLDNSMFNQIVETSDEWIISRTGIKERRLEQKKYNYEMLGEACKSALENSGVLPGMIDMIIVSTATPDYSYPSTACLTQNYIKADNAVSFDISAACAGFVFALDIADSYIKSGRAKNILVASGDIMSRSTDYFDRGNCILFGDGAGAVVLSAVESDDSFGVLSGYIKSECDGEKPYLIHSALYKPAEIFDSETKQFKGNAEKIHSSYLWQNGRAVLEFVSRIVPGALNEVVKKAGVTVDDLKYIILHQANKRIINHVIEKYKLNPENKLNRGDLIALVGFGSGLTYGAAVIRWR